MIICLDFVNILRFFFVVFKIRINYNNPRGDFMMEKIYIAEDETAIRESVQTFLESEGYHVIGFSDGDSLFESFLKEPSDMVILDVMMPGSTGFQITKKIREISTVPIIILTARDSEIDYATGINLGSDDYFTKPFSVISLVMRVKAMFRRVQFDNQQTIDQCDDELFFADVTINKKSMKVYRDSTIIELTPSEYNLFVYLVENKDRAISRDELLDNVWGYGKDIETRACDDTVRRLRKKLIHSNVKVETIWGFGFTLKEEASNEK